MEKKGRGVRGKEGRKSSMHNAGILVGGREREITMDCKPRLDQLYQITTSRTHLKRHLLNPRCVYVLKESYVNKLKVSPKPGNKEYHLSPILKKHFPPRDK